MKFEILNLISGKKKEIEKRQKKDIKVPEKETEIVPETIIFRLYKCKYACHKSRTCLSKSFIWKIMEIKSEIDDQRLVGHLQVQNSQFGQWLRNDNVVINMLKE